MHFRWNIIGHEKELLFLEDRLKEREKQAFPHAMLFVGPENIGKFTAAKTLAQILQCPNNFCRVCPVCVQVSKGHHFDTIQMDDDGESIKIEQIREILGRLSMTSQSLYKILILGNIGRMTEEAGNSLLKMLEEPFDGTFFVFTAAYLREVLPTIRSRMQIVKFKLVPEEQLRASLEEQYPDISTATFDRILMLSLGKPGRAIALIADPQKLDFYQELFDAVISFFKENGLSRRFQAIQGMVNDPVYLKEFLTLLTSYSRQQLFAEADINKQKEMLASLEKLEQAFDLLRRNVNARLLLENFVL